MSGALMTLLKLPYLRLAQTGLALVACGAAGVLGFRFVRAELEARVYRERLDQLAADYESLRATYNEAVRRSAVTELIVRGKTLAVRVRTSAGILREIPTPYDPTGEVYVDYVVIDGRLWIRRLFDANTPPGQGMVVDPDRALVDWDQPGAGHGKAVYRRLDEGRWVVTISGDGSLGLARASGAEGDLVHAPEIKRYDEATADADAAARGISAGDVFRQVLTGAQRPRRAKETTP